MIVGSKLETKLNKTDGFVKHVINNENHYSCQKRKLTLELVVDAGIYLSGYLTYKYGVNKKPLMYLLTTDNYPISDDSFRDYGLEVEEKIIGLLDRFINDGIKITTYKNKPAMVLTLEDEAITISKGLLSSSNVTYMKI